MEPIRRCATGIPKFSRGADLIRSLKEPCFFVAFAIHRELIEYNIIQRRIGRRPAPSARKTEKTHQSLWLPFYYL